MPGLHEQDRLSPALGVHFLIGGFCHDSPRRKPASFMPFKSKEALQSSEVVNNQYVAGMFK